MSFNAVLKQGYGGAIMITKENNYKEFADKGADEDLNSINEKNRRIGVAKGKISIPDDFDKMDKEIEEMFDLQ